MTYVFDWEICGIIGPNTGDCSHETKRSVVVAFANRQGEGRLPVYLTRFYGRESELELLDRLLADPDERVITLVGPGGVGKTRLLVEAVNRTALGETIFVDGSALERAEFVLPELVDLLGIDRSADRPSHELLSEHLSGRQMTILFDNLEHLLDIAVDLAALVRALPGLRVIATSRAPMHISGERLVLVEPLATIGTPVALAPLSTATQLFIDRAALTGKLSKPTEPELATIEEICARLDGLPLAIELAAARLRALSLPALLALLTNQLAVLTGGPVDTSERHRALRATIGWSYDFLAGDEQRLLRELGVFAESFALEGVSAVCTPADRETVDMLESLFDQALLMRADDDLDGQPRYRMLTSIRDFAFEQLRESGDEDGLRERHAAWFLRLAETLEPALLGPGQPEAIERLTQATPNLRQALEFMVRQGDQESALRLTSALNRYWLIQVRWDEAKSAFDTVFAMGDPQPTHAWAAALRCAAVNAELRFDNETALDRIQRAIAIWEVLGEPNWIARSRIDLGNIYNNLGRFDDAIVEFERAAALADPATDGRTAAVAVGSIAIALMRKGELAAADRNFTELLPQMRTLDDKWLLATFLSNSAVARQRLGNRVAARALLEESLQLRRDLGDEYGVGATLANLCEVEDDPALIAQSSVQILELGTRIGARDLESAARVNLGELALSRGDRADAARFYIDALNGFASINEELAQADVIGLIAELGLGCNSAIAVQLIGAARAVQERHASQPTGAVAQHVAAVEGQLRNRLGATAFEREFAIGHRLTLAEARVDALALAREGSASHAPRQAPGTRHPAGGLTPRELDVLRLVAEGKTDRAIADALFITPKTANHHVTRILAKLECRNRAAATAIAYQQGLI